jgi:hypothetical protein
MRASSKVAKRCRLSEGYRLKDARARIGLLRFVANGPSRYSIVTPDVRHFRTEADMNL